MVELRGRAAGLARRTHERTRSLTQVMEKRVTEVRAQATQAVLRTVSYTQAPAYMQDNPHIKSGYRVNLSMKECLQSIFQLHNETFNIWSHLIGFLIFTYLLLFTAVALSPNGIDREKAFEVVNAQLREKLEMYLPDMEHIAHSVAELRDNAIGTTERIQENFHQAQEDMVVKVRMMKSQLDALYPSEPLPTALRRTALNSFRRMSNFVSQEKEHVAKLRAEMSQRFNLFIQDVRDVMSRQPTWEPHDGTHEHLPRWPIALFILSAMMCLLSSTVFHMFASTSEATCSHFQKLDYAGICALISGSTVAPIYYGFYCERFLQMAYITTSLVLTAAALRLVLNQRYLTAEYRPIRTAVLIAAGFSGIVPLAHMLVRFGLHPLLWYLLSMGGMYIGGALIYLTQIPESLFPGKFDIFFSSHQLWHVAVVAAALTHYYGLSDFYEWRMVTMCPAEVIAAAS